MDTIKLTLELTPAQLSRLMLDIRTGADVPREPVRYEPKPASYTWLEEKLAEAEELIRQKDSQLAAMDKLLQEIQGERDAHLAELEDALSIRGERVDNQGNTIAERDKAQQTLDAKVERLKSELNAAKAANTRGQEALADQTRTITAYRTRLVRAEQKLDHLRNVCAEHEAACRQPIANVLAVYEDMANRRGLTDEEYTRRELGELRVQLTHLLKEAKRG